MAKRATKRVTIFYAFPAQPPALEETIKEAIKSLKTVPLIQDRNLRFRPWPAMEVSGRHMMKQITDYIDKADVFACDLTYPNLNVAFELGFAIGRFRRIWISLDETVEAAGKQYQRLYGGIFTAGYSKYSNHRELAERFIREHPWSSLDDHLLHESYTKRAPRSEHPTLLYLRPQIETDAVIATTENLGASLFADGLLIDDPNDNPAPSLEWYAEKVHRADAILVHLLSPKHREAFRHNVKVSFVAGLAHAFGKPLRMLAHAPFESPIDYQQLLTSHETADSCRRLVSQWVEELESSLAHRRPRRTDEDREQPLEVDLRNVRVGEYVAEHESDTLDDYFVETSSYYKARESQTAILVGRRGTGKTATLYALQTTLSADKRNHVCMLKPPGYEIDGLVDVLEEKMKLAERGYLIESLWKFLIYTELSCSVVDEIARRPVHQAATPAEAELIDYVSARRDIVCIPFSQRFDVAVKAMSGLGALKDAREQRLRISESLHAAELHDLRKLLGSALNEHHKVAVLIDNLDKPWHPGHHIQHQTNLLSGLLQVATDITDDFRQDKLAGKRVNMSLIIFLRSDIFTHIQPHVPEQDKLPLEWILWNDKEVLLRVLDLRLAHVMPARITPSDLWREMLPPEVAGLPTREFIVQNALARPRDVIYLLRQAIAIAVNRGRSSVAEEDFLDARREYSEFAFRSLLAEDDPNRGNLEAVLYEFAGVPAQLHESDLREIIKNAGVLSEDVDFYIDLLCDVNFLGIPVVGGHRFSAHEGDRQMLREVARRIANENGDEQSFKINAAFHHVLQME